MADVLIVDDDHDIAECVTMLLELEGHVVRHARNGMEGLRALAQRKPDLILLDLEMPVLDGPGMATQLFIHDVGYENVPIVLASGASDLPVISRRLGVPYTLPKPFGGDELLAMVQRAIDERRPPAPSYHRAEVLGLKSLWEEAQAEDAR